MEPIDSTATDEITCPHCGSEDGDSDERDDYGEEICDDCGKKYFWNRTVLVTYTSGKSI